MGAAAAAAVAICLAMGKLLPEREVVNMKHDSI